MTGRDAIMLIYGILIGAAFAYLVEDIKFWWKTKRVYKKAKKKEKKDG